jgi:hypothetical protein
MKRHAGICTAVAAALWFMVSDVIDSRDGIARGLGLRSHAAAASAPDLADDGTIAGRIDARQGDDLAALKTFRPGYEFWRNVFTIPDGSIAFGSAVDGRRLALFPAGGDWTRDAWWYDPSLAAALADHELPSSLDERRDYVAGLLQAVTGPVLHNPTRGGFVAPGVERYGSFLAAWGAIYERFGVPAEIGLAQALIESGFEGARRSEAGAVGLCQWLGRNWKFLDRLDPTVIEAKNQTTQAAYCGAYISVLATKYGSFIPALSAHHAGETNVGRMLINGERLHGATPRERYLLGADFARDLRTIAPEVYGDLYGTYGPRSYRYAEMVFGNIDNVRHLISSTPQVKIYAMRTTRAIPLAEISRRSGLSADEVRRFNPSLVKRVPSDATLYLPRPVSAFGRDVAFWNTPAPGAYNTVLNDFVRLEATVEDWDDPSFDRTLGAFERRFRATKTQEGSVMATVLAYVRDEAASSGRREILNEFRSSDHIREMFERALRDRDAAGN